MKTVKARLEQRATVTPLEMILVTLHIISKAIALKLVPTNAHLVSELFPDSLEGRAAGSNLVAPVNSLLPWAF